MKTIKLLSSVILMILMLTITACTTNDVADETPIEDASGDATTDTIDETDSTETDMTEGEETIIIDYGFGLSDEGYLENVKASDYTELPDYMTISIPSDVHIISDQLVDAEITNIIANYTTTEQVTDRAILDGDTVNIDYVGSVDGVEFAGGSTGGGGTDVTIGVTSYIDDFLEQLIGHTPGESFDIEVTFPDNYNNADLSGKDAVFAITLNYISETVTPEMTDEFVATNLAPSYLWMTVDEMRIDIHSKIQEGTIYNFLQSYLLENTTISSIPDEAISYHENALINYYAGAANQYGMTFNDYISAYAGASNAEELIASSTDQIIEMANFSLIVQAIAEESELLITEDFIADYFLENLGAKDYTPYVDQYGIAYIKNTLLQEGVLDLLSSNATLE